MKLKLILSLSLLVLLGFGYIVLKKPEQVAEADKLSILNGEFQSLSQAFDKETITNDPNLRFIFDYDSNYALVGKAWEGEIAEDSEGLGGTNLYLINLNDKSEQKISDDLVSLAIFDKKNYLVYFTDISQDLWRFDIAKNSKEKIMDKVSEPDLSPDGTMLVYQKLNPKWVRPYTDNSLGLTILDVKTGVEKRITNQWEDWLPFWTLDGKKIMFFSLNDAAHGMSAHYIIDIDGQNKILLTNFGLYDSTQAGAVPMPSEKPVWSPDGNMLVYESDREIWINKFNPDKTKIIESKFITRGKEPTWIRNGTALNIVLVSENKKSTESINVDLNGKIIK